MTASCNQLYKRFLESGANFIKGHRSGDVDLEKREVCFSFSSESLIDHGFVRISLSHEPGAMDMSRLNSGAGFYEGHDYTRYLGACREAWVAEGKGYARVKLSRSDAGENVLLDMADGLRSGISMGFEISEFDFDEAPEDGGKPIIKGLRWTPYELTTTGIPADFSVGLGRSMNANFFEEGEIMEAKEQKRVAAEASFGAEDNKEALELLRRENERVSEILAIGEEFSESSLAGQYIREKKSAKDFSFAVMKKLSARSVSEAEPLKDPDNIGLTKKEAGSFSILRAIEAVAASNWDLAPFEKEVSEAAAKKYGKRSGEGSLIIPSDILNHGFTRDVVENVVDTEDIAGGIKKAVVGERFIDALKAMTLSGRVGATWLTGLRGELSLPKQTAKSSGGWISEGEDAPYTGLTVGNIVLSPNTVGAIIPVTRRTLLNASFSMESLIRRDIMDAIRYQIDHALLEGGSSSKEPLGILKTKGISNLSTPKLSHDNILWLEAEVTSKDVEGSLSYICSPHVRQILKGTPRQDGTHQSLWETSQNGEGYMNGYRAIVSTLVPTAANKTSLLFGRWSDALICQWGPGIELQINPYSDSGNIKVRALLDMDVKFRYEESFAFLKDIAVSGGGTPGNAESFAGGGSASEEKPSKKIKEKDKE